MAAATEAAESVIRFEAEVVSVEGRRIVRLPTEASAQLPSRGQVAVEGTLDGRDFTGVLEPDGLRGHWLDIDRPSALAPNSADSSTPSPSNETVSVVLTPTKAWPEPEVPADLRAALDAAPSSAATWLDITPMARWEWVRWITATRSPSTRDRRIEVGISKLDRGSRRPCCFDLSSCTDPDLSRSGKLLLPSH
ncbi:YdeI/OmpD-associated family protein [Herbiconiux sp. P15]|uniref:YdeI/OmpD-associated family protein n=1 Tax=Herbiconiux liukaitaii TaxID=3342799 RepID=UPI0035B6DC6F